MNAFMRSILVAGVSVAMGAAPALAEGNLASNRTDLEIKIDTEKLQYSQTVFELETGKYYFLSVTSDGGDEVAWFAPELWRNSWVNQIVANDLEVKAFGIYSLEFDAAGTITVSFVPIRPGEYEFYSPGYEDKGLKGKFVVK
ncbi:MAG: hypothetical protein ABL866_00320 [Devosia sp.]